MKKVLFSLLCLATFALSGSEAKLPRTPSPAGAKVYIIAPLDGETITAPFKVVFGLKGMGIAPAGIDFPNSGHHHLLVNMDKLPTMDLPMPASENLIHFGLGQTETELSLPPGKHTLQLLLGDKLHIPHLPAVISKRITITVE